eukprot:Clim_evm9s70 gene=Clim_evmTU9s70
MPQMGSLSKADEQQSLAMGFWSLCHYTGQHGAEQSCSSLNANCEVTFDHHDYFIFQKKVPIIDEENCSQWNGWRFAWFSSVMMLLFSNVLNCIGAFKPQSTLLSIEFILSASTFILLKGLVIHCFVLNNQVLFDALEMVDAEVPELAAADLSFGWSLPLLILTLVALFCGLCEHVKLLRNVRDHMI